MWNWIERRSFFTRWVLVPIAFFGTASLVHGSIIIGSRFINIIWGPDARDFLWLSEFVLAQYFSAFLSCQVAGATAPKFKFGTTCVCSSVYLFGNIAIVYGIVAMSVGRDPETIVTVFFTTVGAISAIWGAKTNSRFFDPRSTRTPSRHRRKYF